MAIYKEKTLRIEAGTHRKFKAFVVRKGLKICPLVTTIIDEYLKAKGSEDKARRVGR